MAENDVLFELRPTSDIIEQQQNILRCYFPYADQIKDKPVYQIRIQTAINVISIMEKEGPHIPEGRLRYAKTVSELTAERGRNALEDFTKFFSTQIFQYRREGSS